MSQPRFRLHVIVTVVVLFIAAMIVVSRSAPVGAESTKRNPVVENATQKVQQGEQIFRFDTFGDQAFWGDTLKLHQAIEGAKLGGVGPGVSPKTALAVGLKVDVDAFPSNLVQQIEHGKVNLNDPAVTLALLKLNAVVGLTGFFNSSGTLKLVGIQCALCHSTRTGAGRKSDQPTASHRWRRHRNERVGSVSNSSSLWSRGSESPYVDRLGFSAALECFRGQP